MLTQTLMKIQRLAYVVATVPQMTQKSICPIPWVYFLNINVTRMYKGFHFLLDTFFSPVSCRTKWRSGDSSYNHMRGRSKLRKWGREGKGRLRAICSGLKYYIWGRIRVSTFLRHPLINGICISFLVANANCFTFLRNIVLISQTESAPLCE